MGIVAQIDGGDFDAIREEERFTRVILTQGVNQALKSAPVALPSPSP